MITRIGICGYPGTGRMTAARFLAQHIPGAVIRGFHDETADVNELLQDWDEDEPKVFTTPWKTSLDIHFEGRLLGPNFWQKRLNDWAVLGTHSLAMHIVPDILYQEELDWVKERGPVFKIVGPVRAHHDCNYEFPDLSGVDAEIDDSGNKMAFWSATIRTWLNYERNDLLKSHFNSMRSQKP